VPPHAPGRNIVAHDVLTVEAFYCLTHQYPLRDWVLDDKILSYAQQESADAETCDPATGQSFVTGNETHFILRQLSGSAWFVNDQSHLQPIPDGSTYVCLAQKYYVLDGRTDAEIASFAPDPTPATCT
jgi:hypothetical protein